MVECPKKQCFYIFIGNPNRCYSCYYASNYPKQLQKCLGLTTPCTTGHCVSWKHTFSNGTEEVAKGCDISSTFGICTPGIDTCKLLTSLENLKTCSYSCCDTDLCNGGATQTPMKTILGFVFLIVIVFLY